MCYFVCLTYQHSAFLKRFLDLVWEDNGCVAGSALHHLPNPSIPQASARCQAVAAAAARGPSGQCGHGGHPTARQHLCYISAPGATRTNRQRAAGTATLGTCVNSDSHRVFKSGENSAICEGKTLVPTTLQHLGHISAPEAMRANCQRAARTAASGAGVNSENHAVLKSREIPLYTKEKLSTPRIVNVR